MGLVPGHRYVVVQGVNLDVDAGTVPEDIIPAGGLYNWQATAVQLRIVSDSADDSAAGTGARTVLIQGLDNSFAEIQETITLNGLTPVNTVNLYRRVARVTVLTVGALETNAGLIILETTGAVSQARIPPGYGVSQNCLYTVPAGFTAWVLEAFVAQMEFGSTGAYASFQLMARAQGGAFTSRAVVTTSSGTPTQTIRTSGWRPAPTGADLVVRVTQVGAMNMLCAATLTLLLTPSS